MKEAATEIQPFHSRSVYSGNAALSFQHLNGDVPLTTSPYHDDGRVERLELIRAKLPGVDDVIERVPPEGAGQVHMYEAAAMLWTRTSCLRSGDHLASRWIPSGTRAASASSSCGRSPRQSGAGPSEPCAGPCRRSLPLVNGSGSEE